MSQKKKKKRNRRNEGFAKKFLRKTKRNKKKNMRFKFGGEVLFLTLPLRFISATLAYTLPVFAGEEGCDLVA